MTEIKNQSQWLRDLHLPKVTAPKMAKLGFKLKSSKLIDSLYSAIRLPVHSILNIIK